ncbi:hypothetical protein [Pararhizobium haloflavum]|uniref:hypothetical protein n=1 Tax=Pararhizobium haloflavum TaxID=2037914 RepID=UPI000C1774EF|nr:hypothetical protein [Pararhizobium haloflavum]
MKKVQLEHAAIAVCCVGFVLIGLPSLTMGLGLTPVAQGTRVLFDAASEANIWTWYSVTVLTGAGYTHLIAAYTRWHRRRRDVGIWLTMSVIIFAMSLDDFAGIHERLEPVGEQLGGGEGALHFAWVVPGLLIAAVITLAFFFAWRRLPALPRTYLALGIGLFFAGAIGLELIGGYVLDTSGYGVSYVLLYHLEEGLEALGSTLLLAAGIADLPEGRRDMAWLLERSAKRGPTIGADPAADHVMDDARGR